MIYGREFYVGSGVERMLRRIQSGLGWGRIAGRLALALLSLWAAVSLVFVLVHALPGDFLTQRLANLENQGAGARLSEIVGEVEAGVTSVRVAVGETLAEIAVEYNLSLSELLTLNPDHSAQEPLAHGTRIAVLAGRWLSELAVEWRIVREEDAEEGAALLRERNPGIDFAVLDGRAYAPSGTVLRLHEGLSVAELAYVNRIEAADIIEANPPGTPGNPEGALAADTILRHGDVIMLPMAKITEAAIRYRLGADRSLIARYEDFLWDVVRFDYRPSFQTQEDSLSVAARALPRTVQLNLFSLLFAVVIGVPLGLIASRQREGVFAAAGRGLTSVAVVVPAVWLALLLIVLVVPRGVFEGGLWDLPFTDPDARDITKSPVGFLELYVIPAFSGGLILAGAFAAAISRSLDAEAVSACLRRLLVSVLGSLRFWLPLFLAVNMTLELLFNIPGLGLLLIQRLNQADVPVIEAIVCITALFVVFGFIAIDLIRARLVGEGATP